MGLPGLHPSGTQGASPGRSISSPPQSPEAAFTLARDSGLHSRGQRRLLAFFSHHVNLVLCSLHHISSLTLWRLVITLGPPDSPEESPCLQVPNPDHICKALSATWDTTGSRDEDAGIFGGDYPAHNTLGSRTSRDGGDEAAGSPKQGTNVSALCPDVPGSAALRAAGETRHVLRVSWPFGVRGWQGVRCEAPRAPGAPTHPASSRRLTRDLHPCVSLGRRLHLPLTPAV